MTHVLATYPGDPAHALDPRAAARLHRLGQRVRLNGLGHRKLSDSDARGLATTLLRDIDETILPRHVRITTNRGGRFTLDVAGRRVLRLVSAGTGGAVGEPDDPIQAAQMLAAELRRALGNATELTLETLRMDSAQDRNDVGCSTSNLATALGVDLDALAGETATDKALRTLERCAHAVLVLDLHGQERKRTGTPEHAPILDTIATDHLDDIWHALRETLGRDQTSGCLSLGVVGGTGLQLVSAFDTRAQVLALLDHTHSDTVLPVLQDIFAQ